MKVYVCVREVPYENEEVLYATHDGNKAMNWLAEHKGDTWGNPCVQVWDDGHQEDSIYN